MSVPGVSYAADLLSYMVLMHLLWPSRSSLYFNLTVEQRVLEMEDLEFTGLMNADTSSILSGLSQVSSDSQSSYPIEINT